jgi:hypothetical protein
MPDPRKHHYVPEFYLRNFSKNEKLEVFDLQKRSFRPSTPNNEAHIRDFYRLDNDPETPDQFEVETKFLPEIEGKAKIIIDGIIEKKTLPPENSEEYAFLCIFIGLSFGRTPATRRLFSDILDQIWHFKVQILADLGPEGLEKLAEDRKIPKEHRVSFEDVQSLAASGSVRLEMNQGYVVGETLSMGVKMAELLSQRRWQVLITPLSALVTSDRPVLLQNTNPEISGPPGFALANTVVQIPLASSISLLGTYEEPKSLITQLNRSQIARHNSQTIMNADRFIYSVDKDFEYMDYDGSIKKSSDLVNFKHKQ